MKYTRAHYAFTLVRIFLLLTFSLFLSGCWWQEMLCNSAMRLEHNNSRMFYDECTAINDPATRGWLIEK